MLYFDSERLQSLLIATLWCASIVSGNIVTSVGKIPAANQTWGFNPTDRCRLLAHKSAVVKNGQQHILVIDGGFGKFLTKVNGITTEVLDLNPFTVAFDLSKDFSTPGLAPAWFYRKPYNSTQRFQITNIGGLWTSADGNSLFYQGGHYYNGLNWSESLYHVDKKEIPDWQLWRMDVNNYKAGWKDVTNDTKGHELANRTFAGAAVSIPALGTNYWLGGITDRTTSPSTPNDTLQQTSSQMLIYNQSSNSITEQSYYTAATTDGYYQGNLIHLPIGSGKGYLMSLMSLKNALNTPWVDQDGESGNIELGIPVTFDAIPLYDLETGTWSEQKSAWFMDEVPAPRTRFCSALFHDENTNTWDLWVHGGQLISDQNQGVREIYVLSMPSFIWSKVQTTLSDTNLIRSHSCHAVGSQFVIVGGAPPSVYEPTNATCDSEYIKVLNIGENSISWDGSFTTSTTYKTPKIIHNVVNGRTTPIAGFATTKLQADFEHKSKSSSSNIGAIAGGVVGGVVVLAVIGFFAWRIVKKQRANRTTRPFAPTAAHGSDHSSHRASTPPEVFKDGHASDNRPSVHRVSEVGYHPARTPDPAPKPMAELESPTAMRAISPSQVMSRPTTDYRLD